MSTDDTSYAPKSPDLSSFYASGPTDPSPQQQTAPSYADQYHLQPPPPVTQNFPSYNPPGQGFNENYIPPTQTRYQPPVPGSFQDPTFGGPAPPPADFAGVPYGQDPFPPHGSLPPPLDQEGLLPLLDQSQSQSQPPPQPQTQDMPPRKAAAPPAAAAILEPSPVRTKFPTARIKRIMQADEEVGKVAQQTPIAVGKALEMFMVQLVQKSAAVAKEKGTKKVTAGMLKQVVESDDQWDFLRDIVGKVDPDKEPKSKAKQESESDEEFEEPKKKKGGRGGGKRKKSEA